MTNLSLAQKARLLKRKGEKYVRLAYELEHDAAVLRDGGLVGAANQAHDLSSILGRLGRAMRDG